MVKITLATKVDISQILEIEKEAFSPPWTHNALLNELSKDDSYFIIAKENTTKLSSIVEPSPACRAQHTILGFALMRQVGDDGELLKIATDKTARRKGVGDLLMTAVLDKAKSNAFPSVFLEVRSSNTAAIRLYEKHGFKTIRIRKDYYTDPIEDAVILVKPV